MAGVTRREFLTVAGSAATAVVVANILPVSFVDKLMVSLYNNTKDETFSLDVSLSRTGLRANRPLDPMRPKYGQVVVDDNRIYRLRLQPHINNPHGWNYQMNLNTPQFYVVIDYNLYGRPHRIMPVNRGIKGVDEQLDGTLAPTYWIDFTEPVTNESLPIDLTFVPQLKDIAKQPIHFSIGDLGSPVFENTEFEIGTIGGETFLYKAGRPLDMKNIELT